MHAVMYSPRQRRTSWGTRGWRAKLFGNVDRKAENKPVWFLQSWLVNVLVALEGFWTSATEVDFFFVVKILLNLLKSFTSKFLFCVWNFHSRPVFSFGQSYLFLLCVTLTSATGRCRHNNAARFLALNSGRACGCPGHIYVTVTDIKVESGRNCCYLRSVLPVGSQFCWL